MKKVYVLSIVLFFALSLHSFAQSIKYVKPGGTGNGSSWALASGDLQAMIDSSTGEDSIWVAKGVYKATSAPWPTTTDGVAITARDNAFVIKKGAKVFGGFVGTETSFDERDFVLNETVLSGDLNNDGIASNGDAYHIIISLNNSDDSEVNGFTLKNGFANGTKSMGTSTATTATSLSQSNGGAVCTRGTNTGTTFKNLIIIDNYALNSGGAVYQRTGGVAKEFRWENVKFINNSSGATGGAMYTYPSINTPNLMLEGCTFDGNKAVGAGGAIYHNGAVSGIVTLNNSVVKNSTSGGSGGAIYITQSSATNNTFLTNCNFESNKSTGTSATYGGHIYINRNLIVNKSRFYDGLNVQGGAIYASSTGTVYVYDSQFEANKSTSTGSATNSGGGGAIYLGANTTKKGRIENCTFVGNISANLGGAIHFQTNATPIVNSSFSKNIAAFGGGALSFYGAATTGINLDIFNSLFYANEARGTAATWAGGAIFLRDYSSAQIVNSTFYANKAVTVGGAVFQANNDANLNGNSGVIKSGIYNSIFQGNTAGTFADIRTVGTNSLVVKNSLTQIFGVDGIDDNIVGVNAAFESIDETNSAFLRLSSTSRAINVAETSFLNDTIVTDLQGKNRIIYDFLDLGAYEYDGTLDNLVAFQIAENSPAGTTVGRLTSTIGGTLAWQILSGNTGNSFVLNAVTGDIAVANSTLLDFETTKVFRLRVRVTNGTVTNIFTAFVVVENVMEDPQTPILSNKDRGEVRSYFPRLEGKAEPLSTVYIYMDKQLTTYTTQTDSKGNWNFKFGEQIAPGIHSFYIVTENSLGKSNASLEVSANFILYPGVVSPNNILTPNNDGKNDVWIIAHLPLMYPKNEVIVFDKSGKVVFQKSSYQNDWDGTYNGAPLNTGTYYYHINIGADLKPIKGSLTILRGR